MVPLLKRTLDKGLEINERVAASVSNGFDWVFNREELVQSGRTQFELVHQGDPMAVRYYDLAGEKEIQLADGSQMRVARKQHPVPLVLVPPLAVTSDVFDLMPNKSLARYMAARGYKTYLIDWGKPEKRHAHLAMKDYADVMMGQALAEVRRHSGQQEVSLMGWCMGGLFCLMHAGLRKDPRIVNIVTIASPIDLRGGGVVAGIGQVLNTPAKLLRKVTDFRLHSLDPATLHTPGWMTTLIFKLTDPVGSFTTYWDLLTRLWDREFVESHSTTSDYLNNMLIYPGGVLQDMLVHVAVDNKLADGRIEVGKKISRFRNITASVLVFGGESDALVPVAATQRVMDLVPTADKRFQVAPGGHMGVILGSKAQKTVWAQTADWLAKRSRRSRAERVATAEPRHAAAKGNAPAKAPVKPAKKLAKKPAKKSPAKSRRQAAGSGA